MHTLTRSTILCLTITALLATLTLPATAQVGNGEQGWEDEIRWGDQPRGRDTVGDGIADGFPGRWCFTNPNGDMLCDDGRNSGDLVHWDNPGSPGPGGGVPPVGPTGDPVCVSQWRTTSVDGPGWFGSGERWWGTRTHRADGCGDTAITSQIICRASECVQIATTCAWNQVRPQIAGAVPEVTTSPETKSLVQIATWFWHEEWSPYTAACTHRQAPVTVRVTATPERTWWEYGQDEKSCWGEPEPFDFSVLTGNQVDPDAECNSHRYDYPSLRTGPDGDNVYEITAEVDYRRSCDISGVPGTYTIPSQCSGLHGGLAGQTLLPVYELQTVFR